MVLRFQRAASMMSLMSRRSTFSSRTMTQASAFTTRTSSVAHSSPCFAWEEKRTLGVTTPEEVEQRVGRIMNMAQEARSCIKDCGESLETEHFNEELASAKVAVDAAGVAFSELLEELALTDQGVELLNEVRKVYSPAVESLRQELKSIGKP